MMVYIALLATKIYKGFTIKIHFFDKLFRKGLLIAGVLHESIDKNIGQNLEGPQKVLAQALALGGHYSELGEDQMKAFSYTGLIHIFIHIRITYCFTVSTCVRTWTTY